MPTKKKGGAKKKKCGGAIRKISAPQKNAIIKALSGSGLYLPGRGQGLFLPGRGLLPNQTPVPYYTQL